MRTTAVKKTMFQVIIVITNIISILIYLTSCHIFPSDSRVKNPPTVQEVQVQSLGQEGPWKRAWHPPPLFLPEESSQTQEPGEWSMGHKESDMTESTEHAHTQTHLLPRLHILNRKITWPRIMHLRIFSLPSFSSVQLLSHV